MNITVKRTIELLALFSRGQNALSFGYLRERLFNVTPAGLSRLLKDMVALGWVEKTEEGLYRSGKGFHGAAAGLAGRLSTADLIKPIVEQLAERSGHSATYMEYEAGGFYHRCKREMEDSMHYSALNSRGDRILYNTMGRLCLAWQGSEEVERIFALAPDNPEMLKSSVEQDSPDLVESYRGRDILIGFEPEMRSRVCAPVLMEGEFKGVLGITVPGQPLSEREEMFFKDCLTKSIKEIEWQK